jgi:DNA-binding transcriptional LysR family regulator
MEGLSVRVPGPCPRAKKPRKPNGLLLVFFKRRLPKSAVTWQNRNLSFRILEEDTMDRLDAMSTFLAVVEAGSLSAAARQMKTPLTTVSRKVSELESHLRIKLFNRSSRQLVLTDAGNSYLAACKRILADVTEAERMASGEFTAPTGELTVTAPVSLGRTHLIPILADFLKTYPDIRTNLILTDRVQSLFQEQVDVGLRIGALPDSSLIAVPVGTTRSVVCANPTYLATRGTPRKPEDLAGHDCISYPAIMSPDVWTFAVGKTTVAIPMRPRLVVSNAEAACDAACAGVGITIALSYHFHSGLKCGSLTTLLDEFRPPAMPVNLVYTADKFLPIKVRAFLDFAAPRLKRVLAEFSR